MTISKSTVVGCLLAFCLSAFHQAMPAAEPSSADTVPVMSVEQLRAQRETHARQLNQAIDDLAATVEAKRLLYDRCVTRFKEKPSQKNWASVFTVHFATLVDEARLLAHVSGLVTELGIHIEEQSKNRSAFLAEKQPALQKQLARLTRLRDNHRELSDRIEQATSEAEKERLEDQQGALMRKIEAEWEVKSEMQRTIEAAREGVKRSDEEKALLKKLAGEIVQRRDVNLAVLKRDTERFRRGRRLGPDPKIVVTRQNLGSLIQTLRQVSSDLKDREPPEPGGADARREGASVQEQIRDFLQEPVSDRPLGAPRSPGAA